MQYCRELLGDNSPPPVRTKKTAVELMLELTGTDLTRCPCCKKGRMITLKEMPYPSGITRMRAFLRPVDSS